MSAASIKLLAVDLDGTLVDSAPDIAHCLGQALQAVGYEPPGEALTRRWIGDGLETLIARALAHAAGDDGWDDTELQGKALAAYVPCYRDNLFVRSRLYARAAETLDALRGAGIRLCCITNKRHDFSEEVLRRAAVRDRFELVIGGDSLPQKKPSPLPLRAAARTLGVARNHAMLVGDSPQDLRAARAAGFAFVWASYGYGTIDNEETAAYPAIESFAELERLLVSRLPA